MNIYAGLPLPINVTINFGFAPTATNKVARTVETREAIALVQRTLNRFLYGE